MIRLAWASRAEPLPVVGVTAAPQLTGCLVRRTVDLLDAGAELRVALCQSRVVVLGVLTALPWCDGAVYLGSQAGLLLPVTRDPGVPADLLQAAVHPLVPAASSLVVVLPDTILAGPTPGRRADPGALRSWLARHDRSAPAETGSGGEHPTRFPHGTFPTADLP